jgi:hypothetical protein
MSPLVGLMFTLQVIMFDKTPVSVQILDDPGRIRVLRDFGGRITDSLAKPWTARTWILSDGKIVVELFDREAVLIDSLADFRRLERVRFVKNQFGFLRRRISYKIELNREEADSLVKSEHPRRLAQHKPENPEFGFEVYELGSGQLLYIDRSRQGSSTGIYQNSNTLASLDVELVGQLLPSEGEDHLMEVFARGNVLKDYEAGSYMLYPNYVDSVVASNQLVLVEKKVYVGEFYSDLYRSPDGRYATIEDVNQPNGAGDRMPILTMQLFDSLGAVRKAEGDYKKFKDSPPPPEHFFSKISDRYGKRWEACVPMLIDSLPVLLNMDKSQVTLDSAGMDRVDEALQWNGIDSFDRWFPAVLAYYGECYIRQKHDGRWVLLKDGNVLVPEIQCKDGSYVYDWIDFYKEMAEGPVPMRWAGDWNSVVKKFKVGPERYKKDKE